MTKQQALDRLDLYFDFYDELRTIVDDELNIITRKDLHGLTAKETMIAAEEANYQIKCEVGWLMS